MFFTTAIAFIAEISIWWWVGLACIIGAFPMGKIDDRGDIPGFGFFVFAVLFGVWWVLTPNFWMYLKGNWVHLLINLGIYLAIGVAWSFYKWTRFLKKLRDVVVKALTNIHAKMVILRGTWPKMSDLEIIQKELRGYLDSFYNALDNDDITETGIRPKVGSGDNIYRIQGWIIFWPFSVVNYVIGKLLQDFLDAIVRACKSLYHAISNRMFRDVKVLPATTPTQTSVPVETK